MLFTIMLFTMGFDLCIYVGVRPACVFAKIRDILKFCIPLDQIQENNILYSFPRKVCSFHMISECQSDVQAMS